MPVEQVGRLLRRWQETGGVLSRGRVIADGMRLMSSLTPEERRVLARALAEEGAPELASRLETSAGGRIDAADLHRTAEGLLSLDRQQIEQLAATLGDRDERLRLAHQAAAHGLEDVAGVASGAPSDAAGPPAAPPSHPPPAPGSRLAPPGEGVGLGGAAAGAAAAAIGARRYPTEGLHALANGQIPLDDTELGDQMLDHPGLGEVELTQTGVQEVELSDTGLHEVGLYDWAEPAEDAPMASESGEARSDELDDAREDGELADVDPNEDPDRSLVYLDDLGKPAPEAPEPGQELLERLRAADSAHQRFAVLAPDRLNDLDHRGALLALDNVPAGWQRRRVAERLISAGTLDGVLASDLLARFPRASDATFVAGAALDEGLLDLSDLEGMLTDTTLRRFAARVGA